MVTRSRYEHNLCLDFLSLKPVFFLYLVVEIIHWLLKRLASQSMDRLLLLAVLLFSIDLELFFKSIKSVHMDWWLMKNQTVLHLQWTIDFLFFSWISESISSWSHLMRDRNSSFSRSFSIFTFWYCFFICDISLNDSNLLIISARESSSISVITENDSLIVVESVHWNVDFQLFVRLRIIQRNVYVVHAVLQVNLLFEEAVVPILCSAIEQNSTRT